MEKTFWKKNWPLIFSLLVVSSDFIIMNLSFLLAIYLRFPNFQDPLLYWRPWLFVNVLFFPLAIMLGLYRGIFQSSLENQKINLKKFTALMGLTTMSYLFMIKGHEYSRGVVVIFLMAQYILLEINHSLFFRLNRRMIKRGFGKVNAIIVGSDTSARNFFRRLRSIYGDFYQVKGFLSNGQPEHDDPEIKPFIIGKKSKIQKVLDQYPVEQVFIVSDSMLEEKYEPVRLACESRGLRLKMVSPGVNHLMEQVKVRDVTGVPLTTPENRWRYTAYRRRVKRIFDLFILLLLSPVIVPLGSVIALLVKLTSPGPVFFKQDRALYKGGPTFKFYKFRTMYQNADQIKQELLEENESDGALFKIKNDPRVTPLGRFLRKYSLDEIPQFINVLKGEMSIVGPRPLPVKDFDLLQSSRINYDWYAKRGQIKPGITGLWQISGRSDLTFEEMCMLDLYYIENQSVFFDMEIIFETIPVMVMGKGAY